MEILQLQVSEESQGKGIKKETRQNIRRKKVTLPTFVYIFLGLGTYQPLIEIFYNHKQNTQTHKQHTHSHIAYGPHIHWKCIVSRADLLCEFVVFVVIEFLPLIYGVKNRVGFFPPFCDCLCDEVSKVTLIPSSSLQSIV